MCLITLLKKAVILVVSLRVNKKEERKYKFRANDNGQKSEIQT